MSNTDSFIEEVSEEVRKDQLYSVYRKYGWIAGVLIALIVGGAAYSEWRSASARSAAQARGDAIVNAMQTDNAATAAVALAELTETSGEAAPLVEMQRAGLLADSGDTNAALSILDGVATSPDTPVIYRDLAALKAIILRGDDMEPGRRMTALDALSQPNAPFRPIALEQKAIALSDQGDNEQAVEVLLSLLQEPRVSSGQRGRIQNMIIAMGGELPDIAQILSSQIEQQ